MSSDAAVGGVRTKLKLEECASGMGPRWNANDAAVRDVPITSSEEECASGMGPMSNDAAVRDAQIKS